MAPQNGPFTAFGTDAPDTASFNAMMSSLLDNGSTSFPQPPQNTAISSRESVNVASSSPTSSSISSPKSTSGTSSIIVASSAVSSLNSSPTLSITSAPSSARTGTATAVPSATSSSGTSTATDAASNSSSGVTKAECHSVSCSPGLQAAVAVPVVVGTLAILALIFFLARRRKSQRYDKASASEKPKKKWTRHLKVFSFDTELLGGGRFSSSNSLRSGRSDHQIVESQQNRDVSSLHSTESAAPPYRDAVGHSHHPNMSQVGTGVAAGALASSGVPRSTSRASAPPPYSGQVDSSPRNNPGAPTTETRNPFSDPSPTGNPTILINETSPFRDPSEDGSSTHSRPVISRNSSIRTGLDADEVSVTGRSDAGSIREAQIGRHVSVASGGRTITNIRNSQSPTNSDTNVPT